MPSPVAVPAHLRTGPFHVSTFLAAGLGEKVLRGSRFRRLFPRVWVWAEHEMTHLDWIRAGELALHQDVRCTGITRLQRLGLEEGPRWPLHFVIGRDHHIDLDGIVLHRTHRIPPCDDCDVSPAAAFVAWCATARAIEAIRVGDWLLHHGHMTTLELRELVRHEPWRDGAAEARWVSKHLDARSLSVQESSTRAICVFAGLPAPEVNHDIVVDGVVVAIGDLVWLLYRLVVEYEGGHHQRERGQYLTDIDRYALFRRLGLDYVQVTSERLARPRSVVTMIHDALVARGYDGPAPDFGARYQSLFEPIALQVHHRRHGAPIER